MLLSLFIALPFALKWPKQAAWLRDTLPGQVWAASPQLTHAHHFRNHAWCCPMLMRAGWTAAGF